MDVARAVLVGVTLVLLASLPCVIAWVIVNADTAADRAGRTVARLRPGGSPSVEKLAVRMRSISAELEELPSRAAEQRAELIEHYDVLLRRACFTLCIEHYLDRLNGSDLVIERLRVEGELEAAGVKLRQRPGRDTEAGRER